MVIFYPSLSITMQNKLFWWLKRVTLGCEMAHLRHQNNLFYFLMCLLFDPIRRSTVHLMIFIPHRSKPFTELNLRTFMDGKRGEFPGQQLHDVLEEYRDGIVWRILGWQESQLYHLLVAEDLLEVLVLFHDTLVVFILKPAHCGIRVCLLVPLLR